jgi:Glycosyl transferase family 2/Dolichyl-phosphate-mannose-protein mannosyltransferase
LEPRRPELSIVVPVRDEAENVGALLEEVEQAIPAAREFEVIVVDDGSRDGTHEALRALSARFPRLRVLRHERGYGQSAAIGTGVLAARGEWIVTMDGDGQNDPADIETLLRRLAALEPPPAMIVGWRRARKDPWPKRVASRVANGIYRLFLDDPTPDVGCGLKLFRRETFLALPSFDHMHRFLPALVRSRGGRVDSVEVRHRPRQRGRSKYGVVDRLLVGMIDILGVKWLQMRSRSAAWKETTGSRADAEADAEGGETPSSAADREESTSSERIPLVGTLFFFALAFYLVFGRLGSLPLLDPDEGRNAEVAREMAISGSWLVPTYNGLPYLDKPSFYFKLVALSFSALGVNETAARLPSALFAAALLLVLYRFCRQEYGGTEAALAIAIVAAMPLFQAFSRIVIFDMALAFFVSLAILAGYRAEEREGRSRLATYTLGAAAAGAATLTKGPVGFLVPALVLLVLASLEHRKGVVRAMLHPLPLGVFLLLVLPWFVGVSLQRPDFPYYGLVKESFERFTQPTFRRTGPFYYYAPVIAGVSFAWSVLLPGSIALAWRERLRWKRADLLFVVWATTVVTFFSLSQSKLPGYVLTSVVAFGVLLARLFAKALREPEGPAARVVLRSALALAGVSLALSVWLALEVRAPDASTSASRLLGLHYPSVRAFFQPLLYTLLAMSSFATVGWLTRKPALVLAALFVFPISLLTVSFRGFESYAARSSSMPLAAEVHSMSPRATVVCFRCFPTGLGFYLERRLVLVTTDGRETTSNYIPFFLSREEPWPANVVPLARLGPWLRERRGPLLLLASTEGASALETLARTEGGSVRELTQGFRGLYLRSSRARN